MSYQLGTELLNYGALLAFMGVNVASAVLAWRTKDSNPCLPILLSGSGFVVCFFLWLNLGPTARWAGTAWAVLGIALWLVRRNQMAADKQFTSPS